MSVKLKFQVFDFTNVRGPGRVCTISLVRLRKKKVKTEGKISRNGILENSKC